MGGWMGGSFLLGIILHSIVPYRAVSMTALSFIFVFCAAFLVLQWRRPWIRTAILLILACTCGIWRFELARPTLPKNIVPFQASGLGYTVDNFVPKDESDPRFWLMRARTVLNDRAMERLPAEEGGLLVGILYGERKLTPTVKEDFRRAGLLHLIAVSGSNVTILVVLIGGFLLSFRLPKKIAFSIITGALIAFIIFVGPSASVVRAGIMGWLIELAPMLGRVPRPSRLLLVSAVIFTLWKPWALLFDASFALSFLAMWGLLTWGRYFDEQWQHIIHSDAIRGICVATIGATLMTVPYSLWAFGQLTLWGLVTSLLALPLVPWIMAAGMIGLLLPAIPWLLLPARGFLQALLWIGRLPDIIPIGVWSGLSVSFWAMLGCYALLYTAWIYRSKKIPIKVSTEKVSEQVNK